MAVSLYNKIEQLNKVYAEIERYARAVKIASVSGIVVNTVALVGLMIPTVAAVAVLVILISMLAASLYIIFT